MNKKLLVTLITLILIGIFSTVAAEDNHLFPYVRMGLGAKAMAMGGTGTAFMDNITATYWNPAALANVKRAEFATMYTDMGLDRMHNYAALGTSFKYGYVALSWINASVIDIPGYDEDNAYSGDFDYSAHNIALSLALGPGKFKFGLTAKMYMDKMDDDSENGFGSDLGILWNINEYLSIAGMIRDIYSEMDKEEIPHQAVLGLAVHPIYGLTFATDLKTVKHSEEWTVHIGAEYWTGIGRDTEIGSSHSAINLEEKTKWDEIISNTQAGIRLGVNDGDFTAGCGIRFKMLGLNYAYISESTEGFDASHQFTLILKF